MPSATRELTGAALPGLPEIVITAETGVGAALGQAMSDLTESWRLRRLVWTLALFDIRLRYRGSLLGPFWLTLSTAVMIGAIGLLYARLFHQNISAYLPFLTISLMLWTFISTIATEGATCLTQADHMIRSMRMPHSLHAARVVARNLLVLAHNLVVILVVFALYRVAPGPAAWSVAPAFLLWLADGFMLSLMLGVVGARFRDIPPIVTSVMQIAFYVTPIMWNPSMLAGGEMGILRLNPFDALIEIMRGPLLGQGLNGHAWAMALFYSALLAAGSFYVFARTRRRIPYWV
ncbi:ABC transporter permease [Acidocella sp.]|uniref:ABC transporter permease n=1 Tax=Acidocella sp. TaxID=50710 RepID=UPI00261C53E1|nr:ABC transporter permease [Acidocella sp.]